MTRAITFIFLLMTTFTGFGQSKCEQVLLIGNVEDSLNPQTFYNLMIYNRTKGRGVFGQPNGHFSLYVADNDSISISVTGYPIVGFRVKGDENCQYKFKAYINPTAKELKEVVITPLKSLKQIQEERAALSMRETRQVTGYAGLGSPITMLYQTFSRKAKNDRWIAEHKYIDNQAKILQELLRLYIAYDIINLTDEEFDDFIQFLNVDENFLRTATEMELITFVKDKYQHYKQLHSISFDENTKWRSELDLHNKKGATEELLRLYNYHKLIDLPESEFDKFILFMNLEESFMRTAPERDLIDFVQKKYARYAEFHLLKAMRSQADFQITEFDNYNWRAELACKDNKKAAVQYLLSIYRAHNVFQLPDSEMERFTTFVNLTESFLKKSTDDQVLSFVVTKYERYLDFYKLR